FWERLYHYKGTIFLLFSGLLGAGLFWLPEVFVPPFALLALGLHSVLVESLEAPPEVATVAAVVLGLLSVELPPVLLYLVTMLATRRRQRLMCWRKQLAALLALRHGPGGLATLLEDDDQFGLVLQRFLGEHQVPYALPLYDEHGRYLFAAPEKIGVLARALLQAVRKGHDTELFLLL